MGSWAVAVPASDNDADTDRCYLLGGDATRAVSRMTFSCAAACRRAITRGHRDSRGRGSGRRRVLPLPAQRLRRRHGRRRGRHIAIRGRPGSRRHWTRDWRSGTPLTLRGQGGSRY